MSIEISKFRCPTHHAREASLPPTRLRSQPAANITTPITSVAVPTETIVGRTVRQSFILVNIEMTKTVVPKAAKMPPIPIKAAARPDRINTPVEVTES